MIDPEAPEPATLEAAVRLARLLALASLAEREVEVDAAAIGTALNAIREQLDVVRSLKAQLTSISTATKAVWSGPRPDALEHPCPCRRGRSRDPGLTAARSATPIHTSAALTEIGRLASVRYRDRPDAPGRVSLGAIGANLRGT